MNKGKVNVRVVVLVVVLAAALVAAVIVLMRLLGSFQSPTTPAQDPGQQTTDAPQTGEPPAETDDAAPENLPAQSVGKLTLYYADDALQRVDSESGLTTLLTGTEQLPRLDLQRVDGSLQELTDAELQRLSVGLVQSYYVDAPATDAISAAADGVLQDAWVVETPATDDAPALTARVRFLEGSDGLWYLLLLCPAEEQVPDALMTAYETASAS